MKAGAFTPATLEIARHRKYRAKVRSMKAGAFTPATPDWVTGDVAEALNAQ